MEEDLDYTTLSNKDLLDLKEVTEQGLKHYDTILKSININSNTKSLIKEYELCKIYTFEDYKIILEEMKKRNMDVKNEYKFPLTQNTTNQNGEVFNQD